MAERTVSIRLSAKVDQYIAAMNRAASASKLPAESLKNMQQLGGQLQSVGGNLTRYVTLPVAAVGVAATKMAMDFEGAFANMVGLAGAPADEIDRLKESVLNLAGETGRAPMELADALYAAMSSGLDAADAMEAVDIAAHGAAAGLGSSADIVSLVASATTSYGAANLDAARAVDILTATIREGRADPDELAGTLGRILPVASQLGVSFDQVGAATAYLSNVFGDTNRTVTAMSGVLVKLLSPTQQGRDALAEYGLSLEQLHAAIDRDGLLGALELLRTSGLAGNSTALRALFDDIEAFQGASALLGADVGDLNAIFESVRDSTGAMGEAFGVVAETDGFKMRQSLAELQVAMIAVGDVLLPIAADIGAAIAEVAEWFAKVPEPVLAVVVALGGLAAAAGPVLMVAGSLLKNWQQLTSAFGATAGTAAKAAGALGLIGAAVSVGFVAYQAFTEEQRTTDENTRKATQALQDQFPALLGAAVAAGEASGAIDGVALANEALSLSLSEGNGKLADAMADLNLSADQTLDYLSAVTTAGDNQISTIDSLARSYGLTAEQAEVFANAYNGPILTDNMIRAGHAVGITTAQYDDLTAKVLAFYDAVDETDVQDVARDFLDAQVKTAGYEDSLVAAAEAQLGFNRQTGDAVAVYRKWAELVASATPEQLEAAGLTEKMAAAMAEVTPEALAAAAALEEVGTVGSAAAKLLEDAWVDTGRDLRFEYLASAADTLRGAFDTLLDPQDALRAGIRGVWEEVENFNKALDGGRVALDETGTNFTYATEEGRAMQVQMEATRDAILEHGAALMGTGKSAEEAAANIAFNTQQLYDQMIQAGYTTDEVDALLYTYGLTPEQITTALTLTGERSARETIDRYSQLITDEVPTDVQTHIATLIDQGEYNEANRLLDQIALGREVPLDVRVRSIETINIGGQQVQIARRGGGYYFEAEGAYVNQPGIHIRGEGSKPEAVFPLTKPGRIRALWDDPRISGPMIAALGVGGGGGGSSTVYEMGGVHITTTDQKQVATAVGRQIEASLFRASHGVARRR